MVSSIKMKTPNTFRAGLLALSLVANYSAMAQAPDNLSQQYCSTENTGSDYTPEYSIYMSMGKCFDQCKSDYAFAVVQYKNCWCSNYIPYQQDSTGKCSQQCPGYPPDSCGNSNSGLYGYIPLYNAPSGTRGAPSSSPPPASSIPPQPSSQPQPSYQPPAPVSSDAPVTSYTPSSSSIPVSSNVPSSFSFPSSSFSSSLSPSPTPTPVKTQRVTTVSGSVMTQTVTQTPIVIGGGSSTSPDSMEVHKQSLSTGAIAGIVVGTLVGLTAILVAAFLLWRRRRKADTEQGAAAAAAARPTRRPRRNLSVLSKTGLLGRPQSMSENTYDDNPYGSGGDSVRHSMMFGASAGIEGVSPVSPLGSGQDDIGSRRHSRPLVYDQRLNPSALFANADANGSRISIQDQNDYSRPLGVVNPEFRASFDSR